MDRTGMVYLRPTFWSFPKNRFRVVIPFDSRESIDALRTKRQLRPPFTSTNSDDRSTHAGAQHLRSGMPENLPCLPAANVMRSRRGLAHLANRSDGESDQIKVSPQIDAGESTCADSSLDFGSAL